MKIMLSIIVAIIVVSGCTNKTINIQNEPALVLEKTSKCQTLTSSFEELPTRYSICVQRRMFQPTSFTFYDNGNLIFEGTDYEKPYVGFIIKENDVTTFGMCDELVVLVTESEKNLIINENIPENVISTCGMEREDSGHHKPFTRNEDCIIATKSFKPLNVGARCSVIKDRKAVYRYDFIFDKTVHRYSRHH